MSAMPNMSDLPTSPATDERAGVYSPGRFSGRENVNAQRALSRYERKHPHEHTGFEAGCL